MAAVAVLLVTGCGDDEEDAGDVERYYELTRELDEAGTEHFEALEVDESATEDDFAEAERQFVEDNEDRFDELIESAPEEIRADVDTFLGAMRSGELSAEGGPSDDAIAAEEAIVAWEEANCT